MTQAFEDIHLNVLYYLSSVADISSLFLKWSDLERHEKAILTVQLRRSLLKSEVSTFTQAISAFEEWEALQNEEGAPGYRETPIETDFLGKQKRKTLVTIFTSMDIIMTQMDNKQQANRELLSYNKTIDILYDYKWRILTSRQKKEEQLAMRRKNMKVDVRMVLIGSSDLNASGDSAWFSDFN